MRVILDTNLLISALLSRTTGLPNQLVEAWLGDRFDLISSHAQIDEIKAVSRRPAVRRGLTPSEVGELVNNVHAFSVLVTPTPRIDGSPDPKDNFLLGMAQAGGADYLVSGDKRDVLALGRWHRTRIVTARQMADILKL